MEDNRPGPGRSAPRCGSLISLCFLAVTSSAAIADVPIPDPPPRRHPPVVGPSGFRTTGDLDGLYVWLGPTAAASHIDHDWDSMFGADLAVLRVKERQPIAVIGGSLGASKWTMRDGGRIWVDAVVGTRALGPTIGITAGPVLELAALAHPRVGASVGLWLFAGVTPYVRVGAVQELGMFGELGIRIALPVFRTPRSSTNQ